MSGNPLAEKIAVPYARALFDLSVKKNTMHQITADFQNLKILFNKSFELIEYLNNPIISQEAKREVLAKTLKSQVHTKTFQFIMLLLERDRINILSAVINKYLELMYQTASIKTVEVSTALALTDSQQDTLIPKLKELTNARQIRLITTVDPTLIGGFLIKTESKVIDFTVKNQLKQLAKHLDTVLDIQL
jgi:F-type H+-transporting ATPase subunit delta